MPNAKRIVFHTGGPDFYPVAEQARRISSWLEFDHQPDLCDGVDAFESLDACDLLVLMGLHWSGMPTDGGRPTYRAMQPPHQEAMEHFVRSGRPLLAHHAAVASYDDCPRFAGLVGVAWVWGATSHSPLGTHAVRVRETTHPVISDVADFTIFDELYYHLKITDDTPARVHATAAWEGAEHPMVITAEGGRVAGAGKLVYLANGHDMRAMESPQLRRLWINSVNWLLER
jgi:type 1 glutamine amidotransferase